MKIIFIASGAFAVPTLRALTAIGTHQLAIITQPDKPGGRGRHLLQTPVAVAGTELNIPVIKTASANKLVGNMPIAHPDLFVVIAFGQKLSDDFISASRLGAINLHGSLLPKFRGAAPIQWSILSGDAQAGVSVIQINSIMDGGAILAQRPTPIGPSETAGELHDRLSQLGVAAVMDTIHQLELGTANPQRQNPSEATPAPKLDRAMSWVDFTRPSNEVSCRIRGLSPWPGCRASLVRANGNDSIDLRLIKVVADEPRNHQLPPGTFISSTDVACGSGAVKLLTVQPNNRPVMSMADFLNGHKVQAGDKLVSVPPVG
jgi:methionyl-tRNA formyltransferase